MEPQTPIQPTVNPGAPEQAYVGNSNIVDRSVQGLYPSPVAPAAMASLPLNPLPADDQSAQASSAIREAIVLILGIASFAAYYLLLYFVKNIWVTVAISLIIALAAIFVALLDYRKTKRVTPYTVIGISAATVAVVNVVNIIILEMVISSSYDSFSDY